MSIPTVCWNWPGFKSCHTEAGHETYRFCDSLHEVGSPGFKTCYDKVFSEKVQQDCVQGTGCGARVTSADHATLAAMPGLPWGTFSSNTQALQQEANSVLPGMGLSKLATDGRLGPSTCGALSEIVAKGRIQGWVVPQACKRPPPKGAGPSPQLFLEEAPDAAYADPNRGKKMAVLVGSALVAGGLYYWWSKR